MVEPCQLETRYDYGRGGKRRPRRIGDCKHEISFWGSWLGVLGGN